MNSFQIPAGYHRIKVVHGFHELLTTPFTDGINALCWSRALVGNFAELMHHLSMDGPITLIDDTTLCALPVSAAGRIAMHTLLEDQRLLRQHNLDPQLNAILGYERDETSGPVPTDVLSFHVESAPVETDTWLCTYHGAPSEGLRNDQARRRVDNAETRAALLAIYGGDENAGFLEFLSDQCYDLHYTPLPEAQPFSFGIGNLWRIATQWPGSPVPPCIHRAPTTTSGDPVRLLLIS